VIIEDAISRGIVEDFFYESSIDRFVVSNGWTIVYPDGKVIYFGDNLASAVNQVANNLNLFQNLE
jgi:hypothetical protein